MSSTSKNSILILIAFLFVCLSSCSQDEGDGKDEGGKAFLNVSSSVGKADLSSHSIVRCAIQDQLRNQCYRELLKASPEIVEDLGGKNPFLLKTWDQTDFSNNLLANEINLCRSSFSSNCN